MLLRETVFQFLKSHGVRLNTDLGQHFLINEDILETIINTAEIEPGEHVVEIGPGIGVLTQELLANDAEVTAIEIDPRMIPLLKKFTAEPGKTAQHSHLTIIQGNALQVPFPKTSYKIVANIPYHITSPLLRHAFIESAHSPISMTLLIQREVAEKICDQKDAGILTIIVGLFGTPHIACHVPPSAFLPPPKVESSVLHIDCFSQPKVTVPVLKEIQRLTSIAFAGKRKMLRNTLGQFHDLAERLEALGIAMDRRPQTLSVEEWIHLAERKPQAE